MNLATEIGTVGGYFDPFRAPFERMYSLFLRETRKIKIPVNSNEYITTGCRDNAPLFSCAFVDWILYEGMKYNAYQGEVGVLKRESDYVDSSYEVVYPPRLRNF
jgi:hypothetical protein